MSDICVVVAGSMWCPLSGEYDSLVDGDAFCQVYIRWLLVACCALCQVSMIIDSNVFCQVYVWLVQVACSALCLLSTHVNVDGGMWYPLSGKYVY